MVIAFTDLPGLDHLFCRKLKGRHWHHLVQYRTHGAIIRWNHRCMGPLFSQHPVVRQAWAKHTWTLHVAVLQEVLTVLIIGVTSSSPHPLLHNYLSRVNPPWSLSDDEAQSLIV